MIVSERYLQRYIQLPENSKQCDKSILTNFAECSSQVLNFEKVRKIFLTISAESFPALNVKK